MKKKLVLVLAILMCISLCACGGSESTSADNKEDSLATNQEVENTSGDNNSETNTEENGFMPNQPTEKEETTAPTNMTIEEMQQYYDVEKFIGTPRLVACRYMFGVLNPISEEEGVTMYQIEEDDRLEDLKHYNCIICDNNTPNDKTDDVVAYIFTTPIE